MAKTRNLRTPSQALGNTDQHFVPFYRPCNSSITRENIVTFERLACLHCLRFHNATGNLEQIQFKFMGIVLDHVEQEMGAQEYL